MNRFALVSGISAALVAGMFALGYSSPAYGGIATTLEVPSVDAAFADMAAGAVQSYQELAPVVIVGTRPRAAAASQGWHCESTWHELTQGEGQYRNCRAD